jgi:Tol biopolymer transport system component
VNLELFSVNTDSGEETQLTTRTGNESRPQFSPDGTTIAFEQTGRAGGLDLALLDVSSGRVSLVTLSAEPESGPHWVDGDTLVFVRLGGAQGDAVVEIDPAPTGGNTNERVLFTAPDVDLDAVSGDGGRIIFTSGTDLLIADRNGGNQAPLSQGAELFQADLFEPN